MHRQVPISYILVHQIRALKYAPWHNWKEYSVWARQQLERLKRSQMSHSLVWLKGSQVSFILRGRRYIPTSLAQLYAIKKCKKHFMKFQGFPLHIFATFKRRRGFREGQWEMVVNILPVFGSWRITFIKRELTNGSSTEIQENDF